jgi:mannosyltransferase OCH1-like enzyme
MIPKKIHTVWVGGPMPEKEKKFLKNNKLILADYEINLWGNDNYKSLIINHPAEFFVTHALEHKRYAFASDVIKLIALEKFGGWSMDADNEVIQSFDGFLHLNFVSGFEKYKNKWAPITAVWGSIPNHKFVGLLLEQYTKRSLEYMIETPNTKWISEILVSSGAINNNLQQYIPSLDVNLYPDYTFCGPNVVGQTYALHHFNGSWL